LKILISLFLITVTLVADISVKRAWQSVLDKSHALKASRADITHARLKQESAEGLGMPSVSITGSYTHLNDPIGLDLSNISTKVNPILVSLGAKPIPSEIDFLSQDITLVDLQVLYPLYMGGKIVAAQDAHAGKSAEAKAQYRIAKDKAFLEFISLYYGVIMTKSLYHTRIEAEKSLQIHYNFSKKLKQQGQIPEAELLHAQVQLNAAKIETTKAKHQMHIVKSAFYKMIKQKNYPKSSLFISKKVYSLRHYTRNSVKDYAGLEVLDAKAQQTDALVNIEKSAWKPKVIGYANVNLHKGSSPIEELSPSWMVGVGVKFDIFSTKDRDKEIEAATVLRAKVASLKYDAQENLKIAVQKTYNEMSLYKDEFNSLSASLSLARENYKLRSLAFKEGLGTSAEVVEAQMFLSGAKTQRLNAIYNYVKKLSELAVLSGDKKQFFAFEKSGKRIK